MNTKNNNWKKDVYSINTRYEVDMLAKSEKYIYTYIRTNWTMKKVKVTLTVDEELVKEAKSYLYENKMTLSGTLEKALSELSTKMFIEKLSSILNIKPGYVSFEDVKRLRPKGYKAGKVVREIRDARGKNLS